MKELRLVQRILTIIAMIMLIISIISMALLYTCPQLLGYDNMARGLWFLIFVFAFIMALLMLVIAVILYCVVYCTNKSLELLKKMAFIATLVFIASLLLFNLFDILFYSFIIKTIYLIFNIA